MPCPHFRVRGFGACVEKEEPEDIYLDVTNLGSDLLDVSIASLYLNAKGDIVVGCDWSYESQDERKATNVAQSKDWPADLLEHDYCEVEDRSMC